MRRLAILVAGLALLATACLPLNVMLWDANAQSVNLWPETSS